MDRYSLKDFIDFSKERILSGEDDPLRYLFTCFNGILLTLDRLQDQIDDHDDALNALVEELIELKEINNDSEDSDGDESMQALPQM